MPVPSRSGRPTRRPSPTTGRPVRRAHGGHDGLGDPGAVRGGQPSRGRLARRRHAQPRRAAARRARRARSPTWSPTTARWRCSTARPGRPALREQICEVMALEGIRAHPDDVVVTVGSQQALDLVTRIFCDPGDVVLAEAPSYVGALGSLHGLPGAGRARRDGRRRAGPRRAARGVADAARPGPTTEVPLHDPELPQPGRRHAVRRAAGRDPRRSAREYGVPSLEDNPYGLLGFDRRAYPRAAVDRRRATSSTSARSPRRSPPACGSAGRSRRTPSGRSWCSPPSPRRCARRRSPRCSCPGYLATHDWRGQIKTVPRDLPRAPRRDARRAGDPPAGRVPRGTSRTAASTSG